VEWGCEFLGTALLVFVGLSAVTLDFGLHSPVADVIASSSVRRLLTGFLFATAGALVTVSPLGRRSGAHLNPAVTFAFWLQGHVHRHDLGGYIASQCAGGLVGAAALRLVWAGRAASVHYGRTAPEPGLGVWSAVGIEALMTGILILTIFAFVSSERTARWTPLAVLVVVAVEVWVGAPFTGTSLNPARSLGPALVDGRLSGLWIYWVGPLAASLPAAVVWARVPRVILTARLFHDPNYRSSLGSWLPVRRAGGGRS
jgi:aquaporin Z